MIRIHPQLGARQRSGESVPYARCGVVGGLEKRKTVGLQQAGQPG